jgi:hypothetical protein
VDSNYQFDFVPPALQGTNSCPALVSFAGVSQAVPAIFPAQPKRDRFLFCRKTARYYHRLFATT